MPVQPFALMGVITLVAAGCASSLVLKVPDVRMVPNRLAAMPALVEVAELDANDKLTPKADWSANGVANVNAAVALAITPHGGRMFSEPDVAASGGWYKGFRQWAMMSVEEILEEVHGFSSEKHRSSWRAALNADFVLVVRFWDAHQTTGRTVRNILPGGYRAIQTGIACVIDMANGRIVWCEYSRKGSGSLQTPEGAQVAVDSLLVGLLPSADHP